MSGTVHQKSHHLRVKQIPVADGIFLHQSFFVGIVADIRKNIFQLIHHRLVLPVKRHHLRQRLIADGVYFQELQDMVHHIPSVLPANQTGGQSVLHQFYNTVLNHAFPFLSFHYRPLGHKDILLLHPTSLSSGLPSPIFRWFRHRSRTIPDIPPPED